MMAGTVQGNVQLSSFQAASGRPVLFSPSSPPPAVVAPRESMPAGLAPDEIRRIILELIG
jgi:hypothetical protein